jgi:tetratricopeptide (TPR) repeat protein
VAKRPDNGRAHAALAEASQKRGDLVTVIKEYEIALRLFPQALLENRLLCARGIATALAELGHPREAIPILRETLAQKPGDPTSLALLSAVQIRAGDLEDAERSAEAALAAQPHYSQALFAMGEIRLFRGDPVGAEPYMREATQIEPGVPGRLLQFGSALEQLGRTEEACRAWQEVVQSSAESESSRNRAAQLAATLGCSFASAPQAGQ